MTEVVPALNPAVRRSQAERRADSEQRLLRATMRLVAEQGTEATSLADIANAAGCSRGLPVYLFGSKQGLLLAVVDETMSRFRSRYLEPALAGKRGIEALVASLEAFLITLKEPSSATRAFNVLLGEAIGPQRDFADPINKLHRGVQELIVVQLRQAVDDGDVRPGLDLDAYAWSLVAVLRGASFLSLADPDGCPIDSVIVALLDGVRRALTLELPGTPA